VVTGVPDARHMRLGACYSCCEVSQLLKPSDGLVLVVGACGLGVGQTAKKRSWHTENALKG